MKELSKAKFKEDWIMDTSSLAKRMKNYEHVTRSYLVRRMQ